MKICDCRSSSSILLINTLCFPEKTPEVNMPLINLDALLNNTFVPLEAQTQPLPNQQTLPSSTIILLPNQGASKPTPSRNIPTKFKPIKPKTESSGTIETVVVDTDTMDSMDHTYSKSTEDDVTDVVTDDSATESTEQNAMQLATVTQVNIAGYAMNI
jgi:hypothetical protein